MGDADGGRMDTACGDDAKSKARSAGCGKSRDSVGLFHGRRAHASSCLIFGRTLSHRLRDEREKAKVACPRRGIKEVGYLSNDGVEGIHSRGRRRNRGTLILQLWRIGR